MLSMLGRSRRFCDGVSRRDLLRAGSLSALGGLFGIPQLAAADELGLQSHHAGKAKSVILIFLHGGAATQDMFDLKPNAPIEVRGEFQPIATSVPGVQISEHLPKLSQWMHKAALVRSVNHRASCHNTLTAFTGQDQIEPVQNMPNAAHPPSMGSVCEYLHQQKLAPGAIKSLPDYCCLPHHLGWGEFGRRPGIYGGYLGQRYDPLCSISTAHYDEGADKQNRARPPELRGEPRLAADDSQSGVTIDRLNTRWTLLEQLDRQLHKLEQTESLDTFDRRHQQAYDLLTSPRLRAAFDLNTESEELRDRYGRTLFGQSCLVARKLVEAGVRFINVFWDNYAPRLQCADFGWDTHMYNFITLREAYLPRLDQTFTALMEDLDSRGLLDETLLVITSDFGRTPRVNKDAGRDHWMYCYANLLAGAGIQGGAIYGESDAHAAAVKNNPVSPADICATIYKSLGIDPNLLIYDPLNRPHPIANGGRPIHEILA